MGLDGAKKGPNRPKWRGDLLQDGLADVERGKGRFFEIPVPTAMPRDR